MRTSRALGLIAVFPAALAAQQGVFVDTQHPQPQTQTGSSQGTDAISQLEAISGGHIDRSKADMSFKVRRPPAPV